MFVRNIPELADFTPSAAEANIAAADRETLTRWLRDQDGNYDLSPTLTDDDLRQFVREELVEYKQVTADLHQSFTLRTPDFRQISVPTTDLQARIADDFFKRQRKLKR